MYTVYPFFSRPLIFAFDFYFGGFKIVFRVKIRFNEELTGPIFVLYNSHTYFYIPMKYCIHTTVSLSRTKWQRIDSVHYVTHRHPCVQWWVVSVLQTYSNSPISLSCYFRGQKTNRENKVAEKNKLVYSNHQYKFQDIIIYLFQSRIL